MKMKAKLSAVAALLSVAGACCTAQADEMTTLKQQTKELKKQNQDLAKRLNRLEKHQDEASKAAPHDFVADAALVTKGPMAVIADGGPITWHGITLFGAVDAGLGYASHGLPINGNYYFGNSLLNKNANHAYFGVSPNNLTQTTIGLKGSEEFLPGLSGVFWASTGINPQSGQLANAPGSQVNNQGLNRLSYSLNGDGSRGGQAFNDQLYAGLSSKTFGQLTLSLSNDMVGAYDPASAAAAFSLIGFSGTPVSGLGDTENSRWDNSLKYKVEYGPVHFGAMYKFADGNGGSNYGNVGLTPTGALVTQQFYTTHNDAFQFNLGGKIGGFEADAVVGQFHQAVSAGILSAAQLGGTDTFISNTGATTITRSNNNAGTLTGTITDNTAELIAAKYTWEQFKFFAGYAHVLYQNPSNNKGIGGQNDQGGYVLSTVNNHPFDNNSKTLQTFWVGGKYAWTPNFDVTLAYYHELQNNYTTAAQNSSTTSGCGMAIQSQRNAACSGALDAVSFYGDYHFTKRLDVYAGMMVSSVSGGLSSNYLYSTNWAPTAGVRYTF